jgi:F-actin capping protein alpha subunit
MYPSEDSAASVFAKSGSIFVNISAEKVNLRNFWSGRMFSTWTIVVSTTKVVISGDIKVRFFVKSPLLCVRVRNLSHRMKIFIGSHRNSCFSIIKNWSSTLSNLPSLRLQFRDFNVA